MSKEINTRPELIWEQVPSDLAQCAHECPLQEQCLRHRVWAEKPDPYIVARLLNPRVTTGSAECPYYESDRPVSFKVGFTKGLGEVPSRYADTIREHAMRDLCLSKSNYYRLRRGEKIISRSTEATLVSIFKVYGIPANKVFDGTILSYDINNI